MCARAEKPYRIKHLPRGYISLVNSVNIYMIRDLYRSLPKSFSKPTVNPKLNGERSEIANIRENVSLK